MGGGGGGGSGATAMADGGGATGGGVGVGAGVVAAVAVGVTDGGGGGGEDPHATARNTSPMDAKTEEQTYVRIMDVVYFHPPADVHKEMHAQCVRAIL